MTAQILNSELSNLVQESKRKNPELRNAAEKSLQDLKSLSVTSESQLSADLVRRPHFITPFLLACSSKNAKFASSGAGCIQRLAISSSLPKERLKETIDALKECNSISLEVQLKILQTLPALSQNYSTAIRGELLFGLLQTCSALQAAKHIAVSSSAAATLQQLIASLYEGLEDEDSRSLEVPTVAEVPAENGRIQVRSVAHDAYRVFYDLCLLTEGSKPKYVKLTSLPQTTGLELIESVLLSHASIFDSHPEQANILRSILMPFIIRSLSERQNFPITVRVMRVLSVVVRRHLAIVPSEGEISLGLVNHMLDPDAAPLWKRALCMEVFRFIYSDIGLILQICSQYDDADGKKQVLRDNLAMFVRMASEKPSVIGLGQQSTIPAGQGPNEDGPLEPPVMEATGVSGLISTPANNTSPGISVHWSSIRTACLDQLDKPDPPQLPETYIYSLVLTCINNLSENLARFTLPLTVHKESRGRKRAETQESSEREASPLPLTETTGGQESSNGLSRSTSHRKRTVPINPLTLEGHRSRQGIKVIASLIENSWPAVLACCSTFLYAALDNEYYRALVRSFQKITQVAGLLRMATPRDAFLTTLGKSAVPPNVIAANMSPMTSVPESPSIFQNAKGLLSVDALVSPSTPTDRDRRASADLGPPSLNARNLLCLRALVNIAIALGPTLEGAWGIVCETLQQADMIMAISSSRGPNRDQRSAGGPMPRSDGENTAPQSIATEVAAVQAAASRLFESTADFPNESFVHVLAALCKLLHTEESPAKRNQSGKRSPSLMQHQRRIGSFSAISINTESQIQDYVLALRKIGNVATLNVDRFIQYDIESSGWGLLTAHLISLSCNTSIASPARRLSAEILSRIAQESVSSTAAENPETRSNIQKRAFAALAAGINGLGSNEDSKQYSLSRDIDADVHFIFLEALRSMVEQNGDSISDGWDAVFGIMLSAFRSHELPPVHILHPTGATSELQLHFRSAKLGRTAFDTIQLVCSDFLRSVPDTLTSTLVDIIFRFCCQLDDLNVSLTMTALFWNISDFLQAQITLPLLNAYLEKIAAEDDTPTSPPTAWLYLLQRLIIITADTRPEVRNTAVHSVLRIFGNCELSTASWITCFRLVLIRMVEHNVESHKAISSAETKPSQESLGAWNESSRLLLGGFSDLFAANLRALLKSPQWPRLWESVMEQFGAYLSLRSLYLHGIVYSALFKILTQYTDDKSRVDDMDVVLNLWLANSPAVTSMDAQDTSTAPFESYVMMFRQLYQLFHIRMLTGILEKCTANLLDCVEISGSATYESDLDTMTKLQSGVIECYRDIDSKCRDALSLLVTILSKAISLPFRQATRSGGRKQSTFIAFSKAAMDMLESITSEERKDVDDSLENASLMGALESLEKPIKLKYQWPLQGKQPFLWQKSTSTALALLRHRLHSASLGDDTKSVWLAVVNIAAAITCADCSSCTDLEAVLSDEQFDINALTTLRELIVPFLGSPSVPDTTRRHYTSSLFLNSLIHKTEPGEYPTPPAEPLQTLYTVRFGRTSKPSPTVRTRMAYFCFSELLGLTSCTHLSSDTDRSEASRSLERVRLAQAAAPYLILRAALPIKSYIADQSLRGRAPQPFSQREELLFTLRQMRALKSEKGAIPEAEGASTEDKRHLVRLFPLVTRALEVCGGRKGLARDEEVLVEMVGWIGDVGGEFGI
ncbi:endosomal peripheral membrane protein-like protein [Rhizodiscina lignyota]|uniref:Endosomal peripheral membrane protein-like protein n=1 Tax=Rhizodiscina lignyota TaxID=1504668 RepID=A0A9P4M4P9_9PEZI|nr:endosomal peripheral membrane protein-like protein [Rhizodiscina lignyota]